MSDMKFWLVAILALIAFPVVFAEKGTFVDQVQFIQYLDENTALEEVRNGNLDIYYFRVSSDRLESENARDGIDVFEVYNQSKNLLEDVRKGNPAFLKVNSYRFHGHARMDKSPYRDQQEEEEGRKKDAIAFLRDRIVKSGWYQETECDAIVEEVKQEMDEALNHARNAADPGADEMYEDVFDPQTTKPFPVDSRIRESLHLPQA